VSALFTLGQLAPKKRRPSGGVRRSRRIPTGSPRLVESSSDRLAREDAMAWTALVDAVERSATARLELLSGRDGGDRVGCPWSRVVSCDNTCRCRGLGVVTVNFLRDHYAHLPVEIAKLAVRVPATRRTS
jgi:hypothetical protein